MQGMKGMKGRALHGLFLVALVSLGCLRPAFSGPAALLQENWSALVVVLALAATVTKLLGARRSESRHEELLFALLPLALGALYLQPQRVASDGIFYFASLHSVVVDFDLDFENEYRVLGAEPGYFLPTVTGRLPNNYSVGPALFWLPLYLVAHGLALLGLYRPTGFGYPYFTAAATTTAVVGFFGVVFVFRLIRSYFDPAVAFAAALFVWLATFHVWYMVFEPSMSHALAMASVAGFFLMTHRGIRGSRAYLLAGAVGGVVALVRWQNVVFLPVALGVSVAAHGWPKPRELLFGSLAFALVFSPQLLYWQAIYGSFLLVPQGSGYLDWTRPRLEEVLLSSRHGLLAWAPVLWLALAGIPGFVRRAGSFGWGLVLSGLLALYVNASVFDWWAGASFGSRRFDGVLPAFGLGLAMSFEWLLPRIAARPMLLLSTLLAPFVIWNFLLMGVYFGGSIPPDGPASFRTAAADGLELVYRKTGYPFSWPGSLKELILSDVPLSVYDLSHSRSVANNVDMRMGDTDALHLGRGWSLPRRGREATYRDADGAGAEVFVALAEPAHYEVSVQTLPGRSAEVLWNGSSLGIATANEHGVAKIQATPAQVLEGLNRVVLRSPENAAIPVFRIRFRRGGA
jgi:hypothetical protein